MSSDAWHHLCGGICGESRALALVTRLETLSRKRYDQNSLKFWETVPASSYALLGESCRSCVGSCSSFVVFCFGFVGREGLVGFIQLSRFSERVGIVIER